MPPAFERDFQRALLWIPGITRSPFPYEAFTLFGSRVPRKFGLDEEGVHESEPHISNGFPRRIRFALYPLRSPLLRASRLLSSPAPTRMLRFGALPFPDGNALRREVAFGHRWFKGSLRLPSAYRSLARPSSAPEPSHSPDSVASL